MKTFAALFAVIMVVSMMAPTAGAATASSSADVTTNFDDDVDAFDVEVDSADNTVQSADEAISQDRMERQDASSVDIDPALADEFRTADGDTVKVVVRLGAADLDGVTGQQATIDALQAHADATQTDVLRFAETMEGVTAENRFYIVNAVLLEVDPDELSLERIAAVNGVERLHANFELTTMDGGTTASDTEAEEADAEPEEEPEESEYETTYGLEMINATEVWDQYGTQGEGAAVAVLDTGMDDSHPDLPELDDEHWQEWDDDGNPVDSEPSDASGHGTHVSGTVAGAEDPAGVDESFGVAPEVELYHGMVIPGGGGSFTQVAAGMEWAVDTAEADVVTMSLGATGYFEDMIEPSENARNAGVVLVASAGNDGEGASGSPGNVYPNFASGAVDENHDVAGFSSGEEIDTDAAWGNDAPDYWPDEYIVPNAAAPGVDVLSSVPGGGYDDTYSGTSMSAPHKAGAFALMLSAAGGDADREMLRDAMEDTAWKPDDWDEPEDDQDTRYGYGIIDAAAATDLVALDSGIEGTVTDSDGEPIEGATVTLEETGFESVTDENGEYSLLAEPGEYTVTATGFGYGEVSESVEIPDEEVFVEQNFTLGDALGVELLEDQSPLVQTGDEIEVLVNVANLDTLTVEQTGEYAGDLTLYVAGDEYEFGEPIDLDGHTGEVDVVVGTEDGVEGEVGLHHTFEGVGDTVEVTTGPTEVIDLDGIVYAGSDDNNLYAYEAATGDEQWSHDMGNDVRASPIASNGYVYAATFNGNLEKLDGANGEVEWVFDEPDSIFSDPVVSEDLGMVWVGTNDARLFGVDLETGEAVWEMSADDNIGAATNVVGGTLYVGDNAGNFWAIEAETGDVIWENTEGDDYIGAATWVNGDVVTADRGASAVRMHDGETGDIIWENTEPTGDIWSPVVSPAEGMVYAGDEGALHAFDLDTGDLEFSIDTNDRVIAAPTVYEESVIFADDADPGTVWSADAQTGDVEWEFDADEGVAGSPTVSEGVVYVGAGVDRIFGPDDGYLYALDAASGDAVWTVENPGSGTGFFADPTYVEDGMSQGTATLLGTNGHNDLFPVPDLDHGIQGTVTDVAGEPIEGATVDPEESPFTTITDADGSYELPLEPGTYTVDVSAFGFETATENVDVDEGEFTEQDFELEDALAVSLLQDQQPEIDSGTDIEAVVDVANVDTLTIEQVGEYDGDLTLYVAGDEYEFGEPIDLGGYTGEVTVTVETVDGDSGSVELHHTFEGLGDSIEVTTGPTEVFEELRFVGVVEDADAGIGEDFADLLADELSGVYVVDHVTSDEALDELDTYDAFFVHALDDANADDWFDATDDIGTVYTAQNLGPDTLTPRSDAIDDPDTVTTSTDLATWSVTEEHPIFDGVAEPGDDVTVHTDSFADGGSFDGTDGNVVADQADGDHGVAVDDARQDVLLTAVGVGWVFLDDHTDEAVEVLGNSVAHFAEDTDDEATFEVVDVDPSGDFTVTPGAELEVDATVENTGEEGGTATVEFVFAGDTIATEEVELEPGEQGTVTFEITAPDAEGEYDWYVATDDDSSDVWTLTVEDDEPSDATTVAIVDSDLDTETLEAELEARGYSDEDIEAALDEFDPDEMNEFSQTVRDGLDDEFDVVDVSSEDLLNNTDYDVYVVSEFEEESDIHEFQEQISDDTGVVYVDSWAISSTNSLNALVNEIGDPAETDNSFTGTGDVVLELTDDHPLFEGVGEAGDVITHMDGDVGSQDRRWFSDYSGGEVIADVGLDGGEVDGAGIGVSDDGDEVILASHARWSSSFTPDEAFTDESNQIVFNAIEYVAPEDEPEEPAENTVSFGDGEFLFAPGQTDTVTMNTSADDVAGFEVFVDFDPEYVQVEGIEKADMEGTLSTNIDNENGTFAAALAQANGEDAPDMLDVEITFVGDHGDTTQLAFDESESAVFASDGEIDVDFADATLTAGQLGDVNNDGEINAYDAILIQQYIAGQEPTDDFYPALADVTQDGEIHTGDVIALLDMIVGTDTDGDADITVQQDATSIDAGGAAAVAM